MSEGRRKAPTRARRKKHWALRVAGWLLGLFFLGVIGVVAAFFIGYQTTDIPDPNKEFAANTTTVYWSDGKTVLGTFYDQNRRSVPLEQIPKYVQDAMIAAEDRTFWTNPGVSPSGMARAAFNIARGQQLQGGSTITQQYVKIMYLTQERTFSRKFSELFIATKLSRSQDKKQILEGYLNTIYFGEGAYGVAAAGEAYFSVPDPNKLNVPQAAFLATVLNNPTRFDPDNPAAHKRILERYQYVLDGMRQSGTITDAQAAQYGAKLPVIKKPKKSGGKYKGPNGYLLDMAKKELAKLVPQDQISGGGLKVITTFDRARQGEMTRAAQTELPEKRNNLHVGLASVTPGTGRLVAMYGGPDYLKSQLNWATAKGRPGSSFKPFAVAAALLDQRSIWDTFQGDSPIEVNGQELNNEFDDDYGDVNLYQATEQSINTAFYDLIDKQMEDGPAKLVNAAEAAGIPKTSALERGRNNPSTVLGPDPYAAPVDMANAYATFAAGGRYVPLHTLKSVTGPNIKPWSDQKAIIEKQGKQAFPPEVANMVNYVLQNVVEGKKGTGDRAQELDRPVAGKTGTAGGVALEHRKKNAACDNCLEGKDTLTSWWVGYTPQLSTAVLYRAGASGEGDLDPYSDDEAFFGGNWPVRTWLAYMEPALKGLPDEPFPEPDQDALEDSPAPPPSTPPSSTPPPSTPPPSTPPPSTPPPSTPPPSSPTPPTPTKTKTTKPPGWPSIPTKPTKPTNTPETPGGGGQ
ncbi:transglycosylase domain-containing protein [Kribbella koreensis]|uniref:Transglycosylase domain-containing protein n=1 Tax=Kribbella koreensis TaxID=57909 RepID=A0ABN1Q2V6_9ACTN